MRKQFKDYLKYIPGFRSSKKWKSAISIYYYLICLMGLVAGDIFLAVSLMAVPFVFFYGIKFFKNRKKEEYNKVNSKVFICSLVFLIVTSFGANVRGELDTNNSKEIADDSKQIEEQKEKKEEIKVTEAKEKKEIKVAQTKKKEPEEVVSKVYKGKRDLKVHFIDVGQGDSIFLELPNGQNALIDSGPGVNTAHLIKYLKTLDFHVIDYLIATHPHEDHIGGLPEVIRNWQLGNVYMPRKTHTTNIFKELATTIQNKGYTIIETKTGTILLDEPGLSLKALAPDINTSGNDLNDYSIVLRLDYNNNSFMFTGDAESLTEQYLLADNTDEELKVNVLKVGHHGSKTSSIPQFISKVDPDDAVITCQKGNSYGHPNQETLTTLENNDVKIRRTDTEGTLIATSNGEKITWEAKGNPIQPQAPPKKEEKPTPTPIVESAKEPSKNNGGGNTSTGSATQTGQGEVYVTPTGSKYHSKACGRGNYSATSLSNAESRGLTPCSKCY